MCMGLLIKTFYGIRRGPPERPAAAPPMAQTVRGNSLGVGKELDKKHRTHRYCWNPKAAAAKAFAGGHLRLYERPAKAEGLALCQVRTEKIGLQRFLFQY